MTDERIRVLFNTSDKGGCLYYRGYMPLAYLNRLGKVDGFVTDTLIDYEWFGGDSDKRKLNVLGIQRPTTNSIMPFIKRWAPITYVDVDDDFFNLGPENPCYWDMHESIKRSGENPFDIHAEALSSAEIVTVSTGPLAESVMKRTGRKENVIVIPNGYDCPVSDERIDKQRSKILGQEPIRIGWWGGFHHIADFDAELLHGLKLLIDKFGNNIHVVFLGWAPLPLLEQGKIELQPWVHVTDFYEKLFDLNLDICIGPLGDSTFNRAKSNIKFLETAMLGRCFVTNQHEVFGDLEDGVNAAVVDKPSDIPAALEYLIEHPSEIREIGTRAKTFVEENYHMRNTAGKWMSVFRHLATRGQTYHYKLSPADELEYQTTKGRLPIDKLNKMFDEPVNFENKNTFRFEWK